MNSIPSPDVPGNEAEAASSGMSTKSHATALKRRLRDPAKVSRILGLDVGAKQQPHGITICCPWHDDTNPSCSVLAYPDGLGVKCFACGHTGNVFDLIAVAHGLDVRADFRKVLEIARGIANDVVGDDAIATPVERVAPVADELFDAYVRRLLELCALKTSAPTVAYLVSRGLYDRAAADGWAALPDTAADIQGVTRELGREGSRALGLETTDGLRFPDHKLIIPWRSPEGVILTLQRRTIDPMVKDRKYIFPMQRATKEPYGVDRLRGDKPIAIVEGAMDVLAMRELCEREQIDRDVLGLPGVQNWNSGWNNYVQGRTVLIAIDDDEAGEAACPKLAEHLRGAGAIEVLRRIPRGGKDWASLLETEVTS